MTTDPHTYKGEYCDLHIRPSDDPEAIEVEVFSQKRKNGLWIEVPIAVIRSMLAASAPAGSYTRTESPDYADGGVTAAAIEKETEQPRPFTAAAIEQLVTQNRYRVADAIRALYPEEPMATDVLAHTVMTALTEPTRPEGAEEIEAWLDGMPESIRLDGDEHQRLFANHLAHMGFRVPVVLASVGLTPTSPEE